MKKLEKILRSGVYSNDPKKVAFALNLGADVNIKNAEGWTPLHWSTCWDYVKIAEILILQANSDIHIINKIIGILYIIIFNIFIYPITTSKSMLSYIRNL